MNPSILATAGHLCRIKLRIAINTFKARVSSKKAVLIAFAIIFLVISIGLATVDLFRLVDLNGPQATIGAWLFGFVALYAIMVTFLSDLLSGHTLNVGQMNSDFDYLTTLPVTPASLLCSKVFERVITDFIGAIILLPGFLTITCRNGINFRGVAISLLLYLQISVFIGTFINLIMLILRRFLPVSAIKNFFSIFGYIAGFTIIIPYILLDKSPHVVLDFIKLFNHHENLSLFLSPIRWLGKSLLANGVAKEFWLLSGFWLLSMAVAGFLLHSSLLAGALTTRKTSSRRKSTNRASRFYGLVKKDYLLLQSDYNIRINAVLLPVTLIVLNLIFVNEVRVFRSLNAWGNLIFVGIIYFCMFGPTNTIGSEGRTISLLETMPLHPQQILWRKFVFWQTVSSVVFVPLAILIAWYSAQTLTNGLIIMTQTVMFSAACIWAALQMSAIFAIYDSQMLQQSSSFWGKAGGCALMVLLIPVKSFSWLNFYSLLLFAIIVSLLNMKARILMFFRLETDRQNSFRLQWFNFMLIALSFLGGEAVLNQLFTSLTRDTDTGLWSWMLPLWVIVPIIVLAAIFNRKWAKKLPDQSNNERTDNTFFRYLTTLFLAGGASWISWSYLVWQPSIKAFTRRELIYFAEILESFRLSFDSSIFIISTPIVLAAAFFAMLAVEFAWRSLAKQQTLRALASMAILPALAPSSLILPAIGVTTLLTLHCRLFASPLGAVFIAGAATIIPLVLLFN